ncbi:hypothetical protein E1A91_A06G026400v1 [Gossypium mustelinum]|uniref:Uncharacterized protein n=3 Tax=Gossypium TaxID=3633 RepID=A0A5J5V9B5_GOSBA|nr:hypothetical protein ES319_A06G027200v1 [Gossypium barbadense]TYH11965.1 hypothetical protein ES288_A06G028100v1 [Gossypium darwinii]TYJ28812.1 hypothetical protein E1A91_A06G026400v1 [Gossypium mustelinum]
MNISLSQCGSNGCESGWTFYLDQSSYYSQTQRPNEEYVGKGGIFMAEEAAEVDLSMVSDASSGPKHYYDDYDQCSGPVKKRSKAKKKIKEHGVDDDTATSPLTSFSKKNCSKKLDFSQSFSGTCFKGKSTLHLKPGNKAGTKDSGDFQERNWN